MERLWSVPKVCKYNSQRYVQRSEAGPSWGSWHCRGHPVLTLVTINTDLALWVWLFCSVCTETEGEFADPAPVKRPLDLLSPPCSSHILGTEGQTMLLSSSGSRHLCKRRGSKANGFSGELGIKWGTWQSNYS